MKILIGADLVPTDTNVELFISGDVNMLVGEELQKVLTEAEYRIFNLEVPLADIESPIKKCGPNLIAPTAAVKGIKAIGVDLLTLANNHILDHGQQGLESTCEALRTNNISYLGVGNTQEEAAKPYIFDFAGKKIGVYACAEHEFSIVSHNKSGANPFEPLESLDHIVEIKKKCDYVIVLYHGGKEHYRYPSPYLQKVCRKIVDKGADLVITQHSHCIGAKEIYNNGTIIYGQGNFIFDHSNSEYWKTSLLVQLDDKFEISFIPLVKQGNVVRLVQGKDADTILEAFEKRSKQIEQDGFVAERYNEFAKSMLGEYLFGVSGLTKTFLLRVINKFSGYRFIKWYIKKKYSSDKCVVVCNYIECEAHRELFINGLMENGDEQ